MLPHSKLDTEQLRKTQTASRSAKIYEPSTEAPSSRRWILVTVLLVILLASATGGLLYYDIIPIPTFISKYFDEEAPSATVMNASLPTSPSNEPPLATENLLPQNQPSSMLADNAEKDLLIDDKSLQAEELAKNATSSTESDNSTHASESSSKPKLAEMNTTAPISANSSNSSNAKLADAKEPTMPAMVGTDATTTIQPPSTTVQSSSVTSSQSVESKPLLAKMSVESKPFLAKEEENGSNVPPTENSSATTPMAEVNSTLTATEKVLPTQLAEKQASLSKPLTVDSADKTKPDNAASTSKQQLSSLSIPSPYGNLLRNKDLLSTPPVESPPSNPEEIKALLKQCETHFRSERLTSGKGGTALDCYNQVLVKEPNNPEAKLGLQKIEDQYQLWAANAIRKSQYDKARRNLEKLRLVNPQAKVFGEIDRTFQNVVEKALAINEFQQATEHLKILKQINPKSAALPKLEGQVDDGVINLLQQCDAHLKADRLTTGESGNAFECYQHIVSQYPNHTQAKAGLVKIETRYQQLAKRALAKKKWEQANDFINRLRQVNPSSTVLPELQQQLERQIPKQEASSSSKPSTIASLIMEMSQQTVPPIAAAATNLLNKSLPTIAKVFHREQDSPNQLHSNELITEEGKLPAAKGIAGDDEKASNESSAIIKLPKSLAKEGTITDATAKVIPLVPSLVTVEPSVTNKPLPVRKVGVPKSTATSPTTKAAVAKPISVKAHTSQIAKSTSVDVEKNPVVKSTSVVKVNSAKTGKNEKNMPSVAKPILALPISFKQQPLPCVDLLAQESLGIRPLTKEQKEFQQQQCH
jgi:tetratricopeptide (TPR) repeat protein